MRITDVSLHTPPGAVRLVGAVERGREGLKALVHATPLARALLLARRVRRRLG